jgi:putative sterol carrier protein
VQLHDPGATVTRAADATTEFFEELAARKHEPSLERLTATFRFDLVDGRKTDRWFLAVTRGDLGVSHRNQKADCVLRADKGLFRQLTTGRRGVFAAVLRGELVLEGDPRRLVLAQRLFPGPAARRRSHPAGGRARRRS